MIGDFGVKRFIKDEVGPGLNHRKDAGRETDTINVGTRQSKFI